MRKRVGSVAASDFRSLVGFCAFPNGTVAARVGVDKQQCLGLPHPPTCTRDGDVIGPSPENMEKHFRLNVPVFPR